MNKKVDEYNGKAKLIGNIRYLKICRFPSNEFWKNIGCLVSAPTFGLWWSRLCEKEDYIKISGKKRKFKIIYCLLFYVQTILTPFFLLDFWYLSH